MAERLGQIPDSAVPKVRQRMGVLGDMAKGYRTALGEIASTREKALSREEVAKEFEVVLAQTEQMLLEDPLAQVNAMLRRWMPEGMYVMNGTVLLPGVGIEPASPQAEADLKRMLRKWALEHQKAVKASKAKKAK